MNTLGLLERMLMNGEITEEQYRERKAVYVETILELYVKGILSEPQMREKLNGYSEEYLYLEEINAALKALGIAVEPEIRSAGANRIAVYVSGEYFGIWDAAKQTFVD